MLLAESTIGSGASGDRMRSDSPIANTYALHVHRRRPTSPDNLSNCYPESFWWCYWSIRPVSKAGPRPAAGAGGFLPPSVACAILVFARWTCRTFNLALCLIDVATCGSMLVCWHSYIYVFNPVRCGPSYTRHLAFSLQSRALWCPDPHLKQ